MGKAFAKLFNKLVMTQGYIFLTSPKPGEKLSPAETRGLNKLEEIIEKIGEPINIRHFRVRVLGDDNFQGYLMTTAMVAPYWKCSPIEARQRLYRMST